MKVAYLLAAAALAACSSPPSSSSTSIPSNVKGGPKGPAPTIVWKAEPKASEFITMAFPVISRDGSMVIVAQRDNDGGRGYPNLKLVVRNRKDREVETHVVLKADDFERAEADVPNRVKAANDWLAQQHEKLDLQSMTKMSVDAAQDRREQKSATAGDAKLVFENNHLTIHKGSAKVVDIAMPGDWAAPTGKRCAGCEPCSNPHYLRGAAVDAGRAIAVVVVAYAGNDTCWEPPDQQRVVTW
jgi:hypothetical protein